MSLISLSSFEKVAGEGFSDGNDTQSSVDLKSILTEARGLQFSVINGGTATQSLTLTGINASYDTIRAILMLNDLSSGATFAMEALTASQATISANNTIKTNSTTNSTNKKLLVIWFDRDGG